MERTSNNESLHVFFAALVLAGPFYFFGNDMGAGLSLQILALLAAIMVIASLNRPSFILKNRWMLAAIGIFSFFLSWRDSSELYCLNLLATFLLFAFVSFYKDPKKLKLAGASGYFHPIFSLLRGSFQGFHDFAFQKICWRDLASPRDSIVKRCISVLFGVLIAVPCLCLLGYLLVSADERFGKMISNMIPHFSWNLALFFWIPFWFWALGGFFREVFLKERASNIPKVSPAPSLGIIEIGIPLGLICVLFFAFILSQTPYFFGEVGTVGLAEAARKGFFQLVITATLMIPLLLFADWMVDKTNPIHQKIFTALALAVILLLYCIMGLALWRMFLYQASFGLTQLRFFTTAFMLWMAGLFTYFIFSVLRGKRSQFYSGAFFSALVVVILLNIINPDAWIAGTNIKRAQEGKKLDITYFINLSNDAIPVLIEHMPEMSDQDKCYLKRVMAGRIGFSNDRNDWRDWNWSQHAIKAINPESLEPSSCKIYRDPSEYSDGTMNPDEI